MLARSNPCHLLTARMTAVQNTRNCMLSCGLAPGLSRLWPSLSLIDQFRCLPDSFFFQAGDCIRDFHVTGVQTCALPIFTAGGLIAPLFGALADATSLRLTLTV